MRSFLIALAAWRNSPAFPGYKKHSPTCTDITGPTMKTITGLLSFFVLTAVAICGEVYTPKPGTPERKAIMDALRIPVQKKIKKDVVFRVGSLKVIDGWALLQGNAIRPDGTELGDEDLWGEITALLRKKDDKWVVLHWGLATDISVLEEAKKKFPESPNGLFPNFGQ